MDGIRMLVLVIRVWLISMAMHSNFTVSATDANRHSKLTSGTRKRASSNPGK